MNQERTHYATLKNNVGQVHCRIEYDFDQHTIYSTWFGFHELEDTQRGLLKLLELQEKHAGHFHKGMANTQAVEGSWAGANDWIETEYMPRNIQSGSRKSAMVVGEDIFNQMSSDDLINRVGDLITIRTFGNVEEAQTWLDAPEN
ncbi:MAG: hypothetical protein ACFB10_16870 [Salibacteraceae bacterium]